jgi:hypothetical protein
MYRPWCWSSVVAIAICLALSSGCAPAVRVVEGKVTLDGKPLESGAIEFEPADSHRGKLVGGDIKDGGYRIQIPRDEVVGKSVVRITSMRSTGRKVPAGPPAVRGTMIDEIAEAVPAQFNTNSTLQVDLSQAGPSDFELTSSQSK